MQKIEKLPNAVSFHTENRKTTKRCLFSIQGTEKLPNVSFQKLQNVVFRERKNYHSEEGKFETTGGGIISGSEKRDGEKRPVTNIYIHKWHSKVRIRRVD